MSIFSALYRWVKALFRSRASQPAAPVVSETINYRAVAIVIPTVAGAHVTLDNRDASFTGVTDRDGYVCFTHVPVSLVSSHVWITADGYVPYSQSVSLPSTNIDLVVGGTARPGQQQLPALVRAVAPRRSQAEMMHVLTNFCNMHDSQERVLFTAFYAGLPADERKEWLDLQRAAGSTHFAMSPTAGYPGSPIPEFNLLGDPKAFVAMVREVLGTPSADGKGFTPILLLDGGDYGIRERIDQYWTAIRRELGDDEKDCIVVPGWELINASPVTSAEYSYALEKLHADRWSHIWAHLSSGRAAFSSNPVEDDDPWQGGESDCWKSHGGQYVEGLLYQSDAVRHKDDECDAKDDDCWLNRWEDVVPRVGKGMNGWRIVHLCYFEGPAYYFYRGETDAAFARRIATAAKTLADKYGVRVGFGNGLPY